MIAAWIRQWIYLDLSPGWWTRPPPRPTLTGSWPSSAAGCWPTLPLAGGALTLAVPHPIIARRTWLWRAETGAVIEALRFAAGLEVAGPAAPSDDAGRGWLCGLAAGVVHEDALGPGPDGPVLGWIGPRLF